MQKKNSLPAFGTQSPSQPGINATSAQFAIAAQAFSGPLPPPEMLRKYEELLPGSAERIFSLVEKQGNHRQGLETKVIESNISNERLGMILGFIMCMSAICAGTYAVLKGKDAFAIAAIVTALAAPVATFVYGKSEQKKDLQARQQAIVEAARASQPK